MRKLIPLGVALVLLLGAAIAYAANDTVSYSTTLTQPHKAVKSKPPVPVTFSVTLNVEATPAGTQPDTVTDTDLFYPKQGVSNGADFPSPCTAKDIADKTTVPAKCKKAIVGSGTATASAGQPGKPAFGSEPLTVTVYNAAHGKKTFLVLNGTAPIAVHNRLVTGVISKASGPFGYKVHFHIPASQSALPGGFTSVLTKLDVTIGRTKKRAGHKVGYVALSSCPKKHTVASKAVVTFSTGQSQSVRATAGCK
jgi:hypothetical protein